MEKTLQLDNEVYGNPPHVILHLKMKYGILFGYGVVLHRNVLCPAFLVMLFKIAIPTRGIDAQARRWPPE